MKMGRIRSLLPAILCATALSAFTINSEADQVASCPAVPVVIVNSSSQDVTVLGDNGANVVKANSSAQLSFQSKHFYTRCGLIQLGMNDQKFERGLIDDQSKEVNIHIQPNGQVMQVGLTEAGFNLDNYISWWGLRKVIG